MVLFVYFYSFFLLFFVLLELKIMATGETRGVSSMPLPPMQYVNLYTDENVKKGRAPKPPPLVKVISC